MTSWTSTASNNVTTDIDKAKDNTKSLKVTSKIEKTEFGLRAVTKLSWANPLNPHQGLKSKFPIFHILFSQVKNFVNLFLTLRLVFAIVYSPLSVESPFLVVAVLPMMNF